MMMFYVQAAAAGCVEDLDVGDEDEDDKVGRLLKFLEWMTISSNINHGNQKNT